jgi:hypothetical protein
MIDSMVEAKALLEKNEIAFHDAEGKSAKYLHVHDSDVEHDV